MSNESGRNSVIAFESNIFVKGALRPLAMPELRHDNLDALIEFLRERREEYGNTKEGIIAKVRNIDDRVIRAFAQVPREDFVHPMLAEFSYFDFPLPIPGLQRPVPKPSYLLRVLNYLEVASPNIVLNLPGDSGYVAALLSKLARQVVVVEPLPSLANEARERMQRIGINNVSIITRDVEPLGYEDKAPYDRIFVGALLRDVHTRLVSQLRVGGIMVAPILEDKEAKIEDFYSEPPPLQSLYRIRRTNEGAKSEFLLTCRAAPFVTPQTQMIPS